MAFDILELERLPRERGALQAQINAARYARKRARRQRVLRIVGIVVLAALLFWLHVNGGPGILSTQPWSVVDDVAVIAGLVFVGSTIRLLRVPRLEPVAAPEEVPA